MKTRFAALLLFVSVASAQTPTPTPAPCTTLQTLTGWRLNVQTGLQEQYTYQGPACTAAEAQAFAQATATAVAVQTQADADLTAETPLLQAQLSAALAALVADETERAADVTALSAATTLAAAKPIIGRLLARDALRIKVETRVLRALAAKLGIPLTQPQGLKGLAAAAVGMPAAAIEVPTPDAKKDKKP